MGDNSLSLNNSNTAGTDETAAAGLFVREEDIYLTWFFTAILAYTAVIVWLASCEMLASSQLGSVLNFVNGKHLPAWMANLYPYILGAYGGIREGMRWGKHKHYDPDVIADAQRTTQIKTRELYITIFWLTYALATGTLNGISYIKVVPGVVVDMIIKTLLVFSGMHISHGLNNDTMLRKQKTAGLGRFARTNIDVTTEVDEVESAPALNSAEPAAGGASMQSSAPSGTLRSTKNFHKQKILDFLANSKCINSDECKKLTGLSDRQSNRLLNTLEEDGILEGEGITKDKKYSLKKLN